MSLPRKSVYTVRNAFRQPREETGTGAPPAFFANRTGECTDAAKRVCAKRRGGLFNPPRRFRRARRCRRTDGNASAGVNSRPAWEGAPYVRECPASVLRKPERQCRRSPAVHFEDQFRVFKYLATPVSAVAVLGGMSRFFRYLATPVSASVAFESPVEPLLIC
jgi:hypothetical protein